MNPEQFRNDVAVPAALIRPRTSQRRWSSRIAGGVILIHALVFLAAGIIPAIQVDWSQEPAGVIFSDQALRAFQYLVLLVPFSALLAIAALLCLLHAHLGWTVAMLIESLILLLALQTYLSDPTGALVNRSLLYLLMLGAVLVVVYLNSPEGRLLLVRRTQTKVTG